MTTSASPGQLIRAPKTAELIATRIRRQIVHKELLAGQTLPSELGLMEQFGVSRPTLREAFRILEAEGLISIRRGSRGGAQVMAPDLSVAARYVGLLLQVQGTTIVDVYDARMVLEPACARMMAGRRKAADLKALRSAIEDVRAIVDAGVEVVADPDAWSAATYRFHELVLKGSGNQTLAVQGGVLADIVATHLRVATTRGFDEPTLMERFQRTVRSYTRLTDLIEARDGDGAEKHWRLHMEVAAKSLLRDDLKNRPVVDLFS